MAARQLSGWQIATLILAFSAIIAVAAVALILGKDAIISIAVILVLGVAPRVLVPERLVVLQGTERPQQELRNE